VAFLADLANGRA